MSVALAFAYIVTFLVSYRWVSIGVILLLAVSCSFGIVSSFLSFTLLDGSIGLSEIIMLAVALKTFQRNQRPVQDGVFFLVIGMFGWLTLCAIMTLMLGMAGPREAYRLVFKIGIFWLLPIVIREMGRVEKIRVVKTCLCLTILVCSIQIYAVVTQNVTLLTYIYGEYADASAESYGFGSTEEYFEDIYVSGYIPRLYTSGNILVKLVCAFVLALLVMGQNVHSRLLLGLVAVLTSTFTLMLGGRSDTLFIAVTVLATSGIGILQRSEVIRSRLWRFLVIGVCVLGAGIWIDMTGKVSEIPITIQIVEKWMDLASGEDYQDTRIDDTKEAWENVLGSPIWGIGRSKVHWESSLATYGGQDAHPFVAQGLIGGFLAIVFLLWFLFELSRHAKSVIAGFPAGGILRAYAVAAIPALAGAYMLSIINTTGVFMYAGVQVPVGVFAGLLISMASHRQHLAKTGFTRSLAGETCCAK